MYKMLVVLLNRDKTAQPVWLPVSIENDKLPLPTFVIVHTRYMADMTEEEWIEEYKKLNPNAADKQFKFVPLMNHPAWVVSAHKPLVESDETYVFTTPRAMLKDSNESRTGT
jgi:hypothetical protein